MHATPHTYEHELDNLDAALAILGMSSTSTSKAEGVFARVKLATWAVQVALSRPGRRPVTKSDELVVRNATVDPDRLTWPRVRRA